MKGVRQGGSIQSRLARMGDGAGSEEANGVGMCSPIKVTGQSSRKPPARSRSSHIRMARWQKTPGKLEICIGAESVRTLKPERDLCL